MEPRAAAPAGEDRHPPRIHSKVSFGIILTRTSPTSRRPEALLVRGRISYEYSEFIHGRYSRANLRGVCALFDGMSVNERLDIYSLDFSLMWYRIWLTADRRELYNKKFAKFHTSWMKDDSGAFLRQLVQEPRGRAVVSEVRWEFPKGKRSSNREPEINCAVREFYEEAGVPKGDYQILPGFKRRASFVHMGVRYVHVFFVAVARREFEPRVDLRSLDQAAEVSEVRWFDIEQIRMVDTESRRLEATVAPVFRYVKRYSRGIVVPRAPASGRVPAGGRDLAAPPRGRDLATRETREVGVFRPETSGGRPAGRDPARRRARGGKGRGPGPKKPPPAAL